MQRRTLSRIGMLLIAVVALFGLTTGAPASAAGDAVVGTLTAPDGSPVAGVAITVSNDADAAVDITVTSGAGAEVATQSVAAGALVSIPLPRADGTTTETQVIARIDTPIEIEYFEHGGILPYVLRQLVA